MLNPTRRYALLATLLLPGMSWAQASASRPIVKHSRTPTVSMTSADFRNALQQSGPMTDAVTGVITANSLDRDTVLPPIGVKALQLANQYLYAPGEITVDADGWVTYVYGQGIPVVVLKPGQLSAVKLDKQEYVLPGQESLVGDHRIQVLPELFGEGTDKQTYVLLKCQDAGESSDVVFGTNKRLYTIRVISKPSDYTPRVAFTYPEEEQQEAQQRYQVQLAAEHSQKEAAARLASLDTTEAVKNTEYSVKLKGRDIAYLRPLAIWDDGIRTTLQFPANAVNRGLPIPRIQNATGADLPNYRWKGSTLTIDSLFRRCDLVSGVGRHQQKVVIVNKGLRQEEQLDAVR